MNSSQDMFEDSICDENEMDVSSNRDEGECWCGVSLSEIRARLGALRIPVRPSHSHQVLFKLPMPTDGPPSPFPNRTVDAWDANHVRMPHSPRSLFPISQTELKSRWELIKQALGKPIHNSKDLEAAIFSYHLKPHQKCSFDALHEFFSETLRPEESEFFFKKVLPGIIKLALRVEDMIRAGVGLLKEHQSASISLSQEQVGILLANAFLSTFPRRPGPVKYPSINFMRLFQCGSVPTVQEKLKCFINYFRRICNQCPVGVVTYSRRYIHPNALPNWSQLDDRFTPLHVSSSGTIEDEGSGLLEIDFANKLVGGGVLGHGSVQEEIKFLMCPELVVARLFTECLDDTEALIVIGCEQFNSYEGYGSTFTWSGNVKDNGERDEWSRRPSAVAAIDATCFSEPSIQYRAKTICRELNKAYVGFSAGRGGSVATGNWGCGAFRGDRHLKALIQLMAAAVAHVSLAFFTFGDTQLRDDIHQIWLFLTKNEITVGQVWAALVTYCSENKHSSQPLFDYLISILSSGSSGGKNHQEEKMENNYKEEPLEVNSSRDVPGNKANQKLPSVEKGRNGGGFATNDDRESNNDQDSNGSSSRESQGVAGAVNWREVPAGNITTKDREYEHKREESGVQPAEGKTCSLSTQQGRVECLAAEKVRWAAYRTAINSYSRPPLKRKISDYFHKSDK